jgi:hypothetical protein
MGSVIRVLLRRCLGSMGSVIRVLLRRCLGSMGSVIRVLLRRCLGSMGSVIRMLLRRCLGGVGSVIRVLLRRRLAGVGSVIRMLLRRCLAAVGSMIPVLLRRCVGGVVAVTGRTHVVSGMRILRSAMAGMRIRGGVIFCVLSRVLCRCASRVVHARVTPVRATGSRQRDCHHCHGGMSEQRHRPSSCR